MSEFKPSSDPHPCVLTLWHPWHWRGLSLGFRRLNSAGTLHGETPHLWESWTGGGGFREGLPLGLC